MDLVKLEYLELSPVAQEWADLVLAWIGFGTVVGLLAKAIMPGRDPGGTVVTLLMGVAGVVIGCGVVAFFWQGRQVNPMSPLGLILGTAGAFFLLLTYRVLAGYLFVESTDSFAPRAPRYSRRRRRRHERVDVD